MTTRTTDRLFAQMRGLNNSSCIAAMIVAGAMALSGTSAIAGCNSGDGGDTNALHSAFCQARAKGTLSTAVGRFSGPNVAVMGTTTLGENSGFVGAGPFSIAIGTGAFGSGSVAQNAAPRATGGNAIAIGSGTADIIVNRGAVASGFRSIAIGQESISGDFGTSVGFNTTTEFASTAMGTDAEASGDSSSAFGRFSKASAASATALGFGAQATARRSVAIGQGSIANVANVVSVGDATNPRRIINVRRAVNPTDAVNLAQVQQMISSVTTGTSFAAAPSTENENATGIAPIAAPTMDSLRQELMELRSLVNQLQDRLARQDEQIAELRGRRAITTASAVSDENLSAWQR